MKIHGGVLAVALATAALGGCHFPSFGKPKAPTGQVVAVVGDREITLRDLHAEMANVKVTDPKARKTAEEAALRNIVGRTVLAQAAIDQGIEKTPDYTLAKQRMTDALLVQTMQNKLVSQIPAPTNDDAERFVAEHPDIFARRKLFIIDQIRMPRPSDPAIVKALQPLKTLEQIEAFLTQNKVPHQRSMGNLDAVGADPRMIEAIIKLPAGEVFVVPNNDVLLVNQIKDTKIIPFTGPPAVDYAQKLILRQRTQEAVGRQFNAYITKGAAKVRFNKDFAPPRTVAGAPGATPAAPAKSGG